MNEPKYEVKYHLARAIELFLRSEGITPPEGMNLNIEKASIDTDAQTMEVTWTFTTPIQLVDCDYDWDEEV